VGKPSWNDEARNFIKNVPKLMVSLARFLKRNSEAGGEPLWLSGKVVKMRK
jgi:hypothetical protein